ncbi:MAG: hypothetical protein GY903_10150 [Fuerstiella sp.]|nr:hypothetical protein [Fuerstiella sp.]MCP4854840.1 hypothetical protein [Fuerstiella sp.]
MSSLCSLDDPAGRSVALNYHDCIGRHIFWFQDGIRNIKSKIDPTNSKRPPAFWPVRVVTAGEYTIELRRWPKEAGASIHANLPPGDKVYGLRAHRTTPGTGFPAVKAQLSDGKLHITKAVKKNDAGVAFRVELAKGSQRLSAGFVDGKGKSLDAFYVYVSKSK